MLWEWRSEANEVTQSHSHPYPPPTPLHPPQPRLEKMKGACETILQCIGEEPTREGLLKTPKRWAEALLFMTKGYTQTIEEVTNDAVFEEGLGGANDMVVGECDERQSSEQSESGKGLDGHTVAASEIL